MVAWFNASLNRSSGSKVVSKEREKLISETEFAVQKRGARGLGDISASGWWNIAKRSWSEANEDQLGFIASGIAFNTFLALIPLLTAVVLSYGLVASASQVAEHIATLAKTLPEDAASIIGDQLESMVDSADTSAGFGLLLALGLALFGALRGATGIIIALNIVYDIQESRSWVRRAGVALVIIAGLIVLFLLASAAISALNMLSSLLPDLGGALKRLLQIGFWITAAAAACAVIALIYAFAPNRSEAKWRWLIPGAAFATTGWIAATFGFSFYVQNFGSYNAVYGGLGAVIIFLIWLYLSAYVLLLGAELNQVLSSGATGGDLS